MAARFRILQAESCGILSPVRGFLAEAGFTHSLTPARNCTYGCTYCYVPTMRVHAGLKKEDWTAWGRFTTFKSNAAALLSESLAGNQHIYCSPLVDPYQPAEQTACAMPAILDAVLESPPAVFVLQTRGPLIVRDLDPLRALARRTRLRVAFSLTTDREPVRRLFEPHCATLDERLGAIGALRKAGIRTFATLAPLLPCDPENLVSIALRETAEDVIADPFHVRAVKRFGATTRREAFSIGARHGFERWFDPAFQAAVADRMEQLVTAAGRRFAIGTEGFSWLAQ